MVVLRTFLLALIAFSILGISFASADDSEEKIVGVWERESEKDNLEETWVIKKANDKWTVTGSFHWRDKNGEIGNFKGKDVKFVDGSLSFTQDYFKLPKGRENGTKITASVEGNRLDIASKVGETETKDTMERAGDASEVLGSWSTTTLGMKETWIFEKNQKGDYSVRGTFVNKDGKEVGSFKGANVRYFMRKVWFNQEFTKIPKVGQIRNGNALACAGFGNEMRYVWTNGRASGKAKLTKDDSK